LCPLCAVVPYSTIDTLPSGGDGALITIILGIPLFLLYGASRTWLPNQTIVTCLCMLPCAVGLPAYLIYQAYMNNRHQDIIGGGRKISSWNTALLTGMLGIPISAIVWSVLWRLRADAEAAQE
jgi:hypothetical protein